MVTTHKSIEGSFKILVINPGAVTTKIAVFEDEKCVLNKTIFYHLDVKFT